MRKSSALVGVSLALISSYSAVASDLSIEEITVVEEHVKRVFLLEDELSVSPDTSQLLKKVPGGNVNGNGPLTGIPQYRGMYGPRVGVTVNGSAIAPAGPNWMDPPLSYAAPSQVVKLEVYRGIAPVSAAQESIGGAIVSETNLGDFTNNQHWSSDGRVSMAGQSAHDSSLISGMSSFANQNHLISVAAMSEDGDDADFPGGQILATSYKRKRGEFVYGFKVRSHQFSLGYIRNETGNAGTPSLPMDIDYFDGDLYRASYQFSGDNWDLNMQAYGSELVHGMTNYHLRSAPPSRAAWRQNTTDVTNQGFTLKAARADTSGLWSLGADYFDESHNSLIDNPNNASFFVNGFNEASRSVLGVYAEREHRFNDRVIAELGVRVNRIESDAGEIDGTPAIMMPPAQRLRDSFNRAARQIDDTNVDTAAKFWFSQNSELRHYIGLARKTRSASFVERYLWLPLQATGGLADGFTYTGNLNLKPETSNEIEIGFDWANDLFRMSPRLFFKNVDDFIQGTPTQDSNAAAFVRMMNANSGSQNPLPLQFNNVEARFYGLDLDWEYRFSDQWSVSGLLNYVRGERRDINDNLYRIAPPNASIELSYTSSSIDANLELVAYDAQSDVSLINRELPTDGYQVVNVSAAYRVTDALRIAIGVSNLFDEEYLDHLAGYNRVRNTEIGLGDRLPGIGRNVFLRADIGW